MVKSQVNQGANTESNTITAANRVVITQGTRLSSRIRQSDGPIPDPYDDALSTPNVSGCFHSVHPLIDQRNAKICIVWLVCDSVCAPQDFRLI